MNKQFSLLLHSILISGALFSLMPPAPSVSSRQTTPQTITAQPISNQAFQANARFISYGRGIPQSRGGGGTR